MRVGKLMNGMVIGNDEIRGEIIKGGNDRVVYWIGKLCNMVFESRVVICSDCSAVQG